MKPKVTVLMPVYNGEKYLQESIDSILNQTFRDFEFLIIDDGSNDNSLDIIKSKQDSRIKLVQNFINRGLIYSLNLGLSLAKGEYIARMDCDDISLPERFLKQVEYLDRNPDIAVLGTHYQVIDELGKTVDISCINPEKTAVVKWLLFFHCCLAHPTIMARKQVIIESGGYSHDYKYAEDYELWNRISLKYELANLPEILLYYRNHRQNVSIIYSDEQQKITVKIGNQYISHFFNKKLPLSITEKLQVKTEDMLITDCFFTYELILEMYKKFFLYYSPCHDDTLTIKKYVFKEFNFFFDLHGSFIFKLQLLLLSINFDFYPTLVFLTNRLAFKIEKL